MKKLTVMINLTGVNSIISSFDYGHSEIKMGARWVTPATVVAELREVWRTEVGCYYKDKWASRLDDDREIQTLLLRG